MNIRKAFASFSCLLVFASLPFHAWAGTPKAVQVAPSFDGPTQVEFSADQTSKWTELPSGTYCVPNSDVVISGYKKANAVPFALFGLIGIAVRNSINAGRGNNAMASAEQALTFSIDEEAKAKLQAAMADPMYAGKFTADATPGRKFEVIGAVVMSFADQLEVLPYVTLRVKLIGNNGRSKLWTMRYIASTGARRPLVGEGSWTENGGIALRSQVSKLLDLAIHTMLTDIATPYPRDDASLTNVHGFFVHVNAPYQVVGYKLSEQNGRMLFLPKSSASIVFAGVNVLDTDSVWQQPASSKDRPLRRLKVDDPTLAGIRLKPPTAADATSAEAAGDTIEASELDAQEEKPVED